MYKKGIFAAIIQCFLRNGDRGMDGITKACKKQ